LAISKTEERVDLWKKQSLDLEDRMLKKERLDKYENWTIFGLGILAASASIWISGQVYHK
jgi:hypothetical protein